MEIVTRPSGRGRRVGGRLVAVVCVLLMAVALIFIMPALFGL